MYVHVNAVSCISVLRVTCPCCVCFEVPFFSLFLCFFLLPFLIYKIVYYICDHSSVYVTEYARLLRQKCCRNAVEMLCRVHEFDELITVHMQELCMFNLLIVLLNVVLI